MQDFYTLACGLGANQKWFFWTVQSELICFEIKVRSFCLFYIVIKNDLQLSQIKSPRNFNIWKKDVKYFIITIICFLVLVSTLSSQTIFPDNKDGQFEDMLTPLFYLSSSGDPFRETVNKFVFYARTAPFLHPLQDSIGTIADYSIPRNGAFGAGKGPTGTEQHHAATDLHVGNHQTNVTMYAAHDGFVQVYRDAPKYRHYLSITKDVTDSTGIIMGKMVTLYAHIDLDLDSADNILRHGQYVKQGAILSKHLYSGTVGGPHLHFEIRYYRPEDAGDEEFYGFVGPSGSSTLTIRSTGSWSYGYWDPNRGYGFADLENHLSTLTTGIPAISGDIPERFLLYHNYPNPFNPSTTIPYEIKSATNVEIAVYNIPGEKIKRLFYGIRGPGLYKTYWDGTDNYHHKVPSGLYIVEMKSEKYSAHKKILLLW